jgi:SnoaL-like protein
MSQSSATETMGGAFAEALGAKQFDRIAELLHPEIDFRALTPRKFWEASSPQQVVDEILTTWFDDSDDIREVMSIRNDAFADREHVAYQFSGETPDGPFVVEQQAYYTVRDGRIDWMRILCSGFRPR